MAIIRLLGGQFGYYPTDINEVYHQEVALEAIRDIMLEMRRLRDLWPDHQKTEVEKLCASKFPVFLSAVEELLKSNKNTEYWNGEKLSVADFAFAIFYANHVVAGNLAEPLQSALGEYAVFKKYLEEKYVEFKDYFDQRPDSPY